MMMHAAGLACSSVFILERYFVGETTNDSFPESGSLADEY